MSKELLEIVNECRSNGITITDEEAENVYDLCLRKIEMNRIEDKEKYMSVLFRSEIKNYLFRRAVNATTILRKGEIAYV